MFKVPFHGESNGFSWQQISKRSFVLCHCNKKLEWLGYYTFNPVEKDVPIYYCSNCDSYFSQLESDHDALIMRNVLQSEIDNAD